jgi:hypothetical protein
MRVRVPVWPEGSFLPGAINLAITPAIMPRTAVQKKFIGRPFHVRASPSSASVAGSRACPGAARAAGTSTVKDKARDRPAPMVTHRLFMARGVGHCSAGSGPTVRPELSDLGLTAREGA